MGMKDPIQSKFYEGTFAGGELQSKWRDTKFDGEGETSGLLNGQYPKLTKAGGSTDTGDGSEGPNFDLNGKSYRGPEKWIPTDEGVCNPDDVTGR